MKMQTVGEQSKRQIESSRHSNETDTGLYDCQMLVISSQLESVPMNIRTLFLLNNLSSTCRIYRNFRVKRVNASFLWSPTPGGTQLKKLTAVEMMRNLPSVPR